MNCKESQLLMVPHILGDLDPGTIRCLELQAHLLSCQFCAEEYEGSKQTIEFIKAHKAEFAEAFESLERQKAAEQQEIKRSWQAIQAKLAQIEAQEKQAKFHRFIVGVSAAAACIIIGISVWLTLLNSKMFDKPTPEQVASVPAPFIKIELLSDAGNIIIPAGTEIKTTADELKTLTINDNHRMVLNANTTLSIRSFEQDSQFGCTVKLASGEIFAHVEHDGNLFVVSTAHGKAIITGTTFDVKVANNSTTLVVTEGTVRFESGKGFATVGAGQFSKIIARSAPTKPVLCNTAELTTWATDHQLKTALARLDSFSDVYDLSDLWVSAVSGPINLETLNYEDWVEEKRDWFKREFPWIFQLKDALTKEGIEVDYPKLLIQSGDIWQFVYPEASSGRIPVLNPDSLYGTTSKYGFNEQWLLQNVPTPKSIIDSSVGAKGKFTGLKAFEKWITRLEEARESPEEIDPDTVRYSLHASVYLVNTRTLLWLSIRNSQYGFKISDKADVLGQLQSEVNAAHNLTNKTIKLLSKSCQGQPCDEREYKQLIDEVIDCINTILGIEKRTPEYEISK
jgi:hypothetical protein